MYIPKRYLEILILEPVNVTLFKEGILADKFRLSQGLRVGPESNMHSVLIKGGRFGHREVDIYLLEEDGSQD